MTLVTTTTTETRRRLSTRLFTPAASLTRPALFATKLRRSRDTMKVTLNTRTDLKTSSAELRVFDVKASTTLDGFKISAAAKPSVPKLQLDGAPKITHPRSYADVDFNAEIAKNDITVYFDNLQLVPDGTFAPRVKAARRVVVGDASFAADVEYAMKGNTANGKTPSAKDVVTINVKGPKVAGFTPKASYSNGSKGASVAAVGRFAPPTSRSRRSARRRAETPSPWSGRCLCRRAPRRNSG